MEVEESFFLSSADNVTSPLLAEGVSWVGILSVGESRGGVSRGGGVILTPLGMIGGG